MLKFHIPLPQYPVNLLSYSQDLGVNSPDVSLQNDPSSSYYCLTLNSHSMFPTIIT